MSKKIFSTGEQEKVLNKCPLCGSSLEYNELFQYSKAYKILNNGKISKKRIKKYDVGPMECGFITCTNEECDFCTDCDLDVIEHAEIHVYQDRQKFMYEIDNVL